LKSGDSEIGTARAICRYSAQVLAAFFLVGCGSTPLQDDNDAFRSGDYAVAEAYWMPLAEAGNASAQHSLGVLYRHRGRPEVAAFWWEQASARAYVPSMLELAELMQEAGDLAQAENLYRLAARWGSRDAAEVLRQLDKRVPPADLLLANLKRTHGGYGQTGSPVRRPDPNERLNRMLDETAPVENGN